MRATKCAIALGILVMAAALAAQTLPKGQLPILTTSAGQSPDVETVNIVMEEAGIAYDYCDVPTVEMLAAGVGLGGQQSREGFHVEIKSDLAKYPKGAPYKALIVAIGASLKGMGASGLTVDSEAARVRKLIEYCKANKIMVVAVHVGGESKRGPAGSDNERMIDAAAPLADLIIVTTDSNKDGRFTKLAQEKKIQLVQIEYALGLVDTLKQVFQ